ncbi:kinase-like protein [Wilcoxina mikolae CBS 423.85]|nr:kinase-like protein [Wilcoxina mikolae CBS 423.85]
MESVPAEIPYTVIDLVGRGSFGSVFKGIHNKTKDVVAIKSLDLDQQDEEIQDIQKEIGLLTQLKAGDAPNITAYHASYVLGHKLWIIMDFCSGGSMRTLMKAGPIEEKYIAVVIRETLTALHYLHSHEIIHRDIKAANILVNQDGRVQLCDFGVSAQLVTKTNKRNTFVGTPQWMAPEALTGGLYDFKIDIWSFGITIYELAKLNPPLHQYHPERVVDMIPRMPPPRLEGGNWSNALREFVALCLNDVPDQRPSAEELQKTKLVKATKASYTIMRDLIQRYDQWVKAGGVRSSMLYGAGTGGSDAGSEADAASARSDPAWDFDTIKSRVSGVPKEFEMLSVIQRQTLRGYRPSPSPSLQRGPRPRNGAEKLYRLFQAPGDDDSQSWNESQSDASSFRMNGNHARSMTPENTGSSSSLGMISIPSFDDNGMLVTESSSRSSPSPSPIGMISMPTEEEMMEMAMQKAKAAAAAASAPPPTPASVPPMSAQPTSEKPTITRTRPQKVDSAGTPTLQPSEMDGPFPSQPISRAPSPRRPQAAASAPSSPPRFAGQQQSGTLAPAGNMNGHKPHHLSSKSVPTFAGLREEPVPPMPTPPKVRSAESTPGPHLKSRSQDITQRGQRPGGKPHTRPSHLNLGPSASANFIESTKLPASPGRMVTPGERTAAKHGYGFPAMGPGTPPMFQRPPPAPVEVGSLEFPAMAPLDATVLSQPPGNGEMMRELDRVLTGLGDALEVVEVGLRRLHRERRQKVPADDEE